MRIEPYDPAAAPQVADLIRQAFAEHCGRTPLNLSSPPAPYATVEELAEALGDDAVCAEASFVARDGDMLLSAAIARRDGDDLGWWRIATDPAHRRQGLAQRCMEAGERALRAMDAERVVTVETVDSRWEAAGGLFKALGYELEDPDRRNITMAVRGWTPRELVLPDGYELGTLAEADIESWLECRNRVFGGDADEEWFRGRFSSRADFDPTGWHLIKQGGRIVAIAGALDICHRRDPERLRGAMIEYVGVLEDHRGRGLGEAVVVACLNWLADRGVELAMLLTQPFRVPAVRLYEKLGFRTIAAWHRWVKPLA
ncbi:MAG: GNAT family N-acetyltransferase [Armatimonadota bacterium]|nr:GNAT family N-acetyltransferase [Armatimonadota bacterium]